MILKDWRTKIAKLKQEELGELLGKTKVTVCRYETLERPTFPYNAARKIFEVTKGHVTPNDLYRITDKDIEDMAKLRESEDER